MRTPNVAVKCLLMFTCCFFKALKVIQSLLKVSAPFLCDVFGNSFGGIR